MDCNDDTNMFMRGKRIQKSDSMKNKMLLVNCFNKFCFSVAGKWLRKLLTGQTKSLMTEPLF